jgi:hypothetical protein
MILKYKKNPPQKHKRMWNIKTKVIPVTIWATGSVTESLRQYRQQKHRQSTISRKLQKKQPYWGTAHILRKVLMAKYKAFIAGNTSRVPKVATTASCNAVCPNKPGIFHVHYCKYPVQW